MDFELIPAYESTDGFTDLYITLEGLTNVPPEVGPAMEGFFAKVGSAALKALAKALNDSIVVYNHWYSNATKALFKYTNQVNSTNKTEISRVTQAIKMQKRQMQDLKRQANQRGISREDKTEFLNEADRLKLSVEQLVARNFDLMDNIFIPTKVSDLYRMGMDNLREYEVYITNYMGQYQALVDKEDDLNDYHFDWDAEAYAEQIHALRAKTDKLQSELMHSHNAIFGTMKMITSYRYVEGDELTKYPINEFLKLNSRLLWIREQTGFMEERSRNHIRVINDWVRDPKSINMDDYARVSDEMYIFIAMREACAQYLKVYMELMLRVLMKAQMPANPGDF